MSIDIQRQLSQLSRAVNGGAGIQLQSAVTTLQKDLACHMAHARRVQGQVEGLTPKVQVLRWITVCLRTIYSAIDATHVFEANHRFATQMHRAVTDSTPRRDEIYRSLGESVAALRCIAIDREHIRMEATRLYIYSLRKKMGVSVADEEAVWNYLIGRLARLQADIETLAGAQTRTVDHLTVGSKTFSTIRD